MTRNRFSFGDINTQDRRRDSKQISEGGKQMNTDVSSVDLTSGTLLQQTIKLKRNFSFFSTSLKNPKELRMAELGNSGKSG